MPITCAKVTSGGKGNAGMFIERDKNICAAGLPSSQLEGTVKYNLEHYLMKEEVDALIGDAIKPPPKVLSLPPLRHPKPRDMRNAACFSEGTLLINPTKKTKFQTLVDDLKESCYNSYWNKQPGKFRDPTPNLPIGYDIYRTTAGEKIKSQGTLYDLVMPKNPVPAELPLSQAIAFQTNRNYCKPSFDPDKVFGMKSNVDKRGRFMKCCLSDDKIALGTAWAKPINTVQANFSKLRQAGLATSMTPNDNISCVPEGFVFGKSTELDPDDNVAQCLKQCDINKNLIFLNKCLAHFNTLRKCLSKRFDGNFFKKLFLNLKYYDKEGSGWLPKQMVYNYCATKYIRFDTTLIEPLLSAWHTLDGNKIEYKSFVSILNFTQEPPELPNVQDIPLECTDFSTTYREMVKPGQEVDKKGRAGLPSGRYFDTDYPVTPDGYCRADRSYLPHETDARICLNPSLFTNIGVSHRVMFAKRDPHIVKRVFEATGDRFTTDEFDLIWETAKTYHSKQYVSYDTFYRALREVNLANVKK